jgi:hypothetical protein
VITALCQTGRTPEPLGIDRAITVGPLTADGYPFVFSTFGESLRRAHDGRDIALLRSALQRALRDVDCSAVVATPAGDANELLGWAVGMRGALLYAYVRFPYRRSKLGFHRLGDRLIGAVVGNGTIPSALWTRDASQMAAAGYPIRYDLDAHERFRQLAR